MMKKKDFSYLLNRDDDWNEILFLMNEELMLKNPNCTYFFTQKLLFYLLWTFSDSVRKDKLTLLYSKYYPCPLVLRKWLK